MDTNIKEKWVAALRSGDYKQGKSFLRNHSDKFCCLGVLCDLAVEAGVGTWNRFNQSGDWQAIAVDDYSNRSWAYLPKFVVEWAGLDQDNPRVGEYNGEYKEAFTPSFPTLAGLNDAGEPFTEIARIIEEQL